MNFNPTQNNVFLMYKVTQSKKIFYKTTGMANTVFCKMFQIVLKSTIVFSKPQQEGFLITSALNPALRTLRLI